MNSILDVSGVRKQFPGVLALADARIEIAAGEVHALVGENGAGKSTLVNVICGAVQPDAGEMRFNGQPYAPKSPQDAYQAGIRVVFQHLSLVPNLTVTENLFVGRELVKGLGFIDRGAMERVATELMKNLGFAGIPLAAPVSFLSTPQKYLVEVAKAMMGSPQLIILDEPTAALNADETETLFSLTKAARDEGRGVIWITHYLEELEHISARITVMRDGCYVDTRPTSDVSRNELIKLMTGRDITISQRPDIENIGTEYGIEVSDLRNESKLNGLSFRVSKGEVLGLGGLEGSGVEEVARVLYGLQRVTSGEITLLGERCDIRKLNPQSMRNRGAFYLPGDRQGEGIIQTRSVTENLTISALRLLGQVGFVNRMRERAIVASYINQLRIKTPSQTQPIALLSGGNQQKVIFARGMLTEPKVFILEEPTQGVDVGSKAEIYAVIRQLAESGAAVIVISQDTRELLTICHRVIAVRGGTVSREFVYDEADEHELVAAYFGMAGNKEAV